MNLIFEGNTYPCALQENALSEGLMRLLPMELVMGRSGGHEYYASLPEALDVHGAESVSAVEKGFLYYFKDWKAFSIVFKDTDISPYHVQVIGSVDDKISSALEHADRSITVRLEKQ